MASADQSMPGTSQDKSADQKKQDRLARLKNLHLRRNEARKQNHTEVVEEDRRSKLPKNWDQKKMRLQWEEEEENKRKECEETGEDYNRVKLLSVQADDAEKWAKKKAEKRNPDQGFAGYEQMTYRQYQRNTKQLKVNKDEYEKEKEKMAVAFYPDANTLGVQDHKDNPEAIDRMVTDLNKQIEKRSKYSRRRHHDPDEDIDYINERNMKFNQKLQRFYGKHTSEIKQNLERGTAV